MEDDKTKNEEAQEAAEEKEPVNQEREAQESEKKPDRAPEVDFNKLFEQKFSEWAKKKDDQMAEAKKLESMTAQEKEQHRLKQLESELAAMKAKEKLNDMTKAARRILAEKEINIPDELLSKLVTEDAEETKKAVDHFVELFDAAVERAVKDKIKGETPKAGTGKATISKKEIMAIKDPIERRKAIQENIKLFERN